MDQPAIKGMLFAAVVDDLNGLLADRRIEPSELEARLAPAELALLDTKINAAGWYDIHTYHRMVAILCAVEGGGLDAYWHERGRRAAKRMAESGLYQQFDYLGRMLSRSESDPQARFQALGKDLRLLLSLQAAMLNFGDWKCVVDPEHDDRYRVEIRGIAGIPDGIFRAAEGTFNQMSALANAADPRGWEYERVHDDLALIRMTEAI